MEATDCIFLYGRIEMHSKFQQLSKIVYRIHINVIRKESKEENNDIHIY